MLVVDHAKASRGRRIRISGGGRCNFTNLHTAPAHFLSANPRFCISALRRYRPQDFIALVDRPASPGMRRAWDKLFCDGSAVQIVDLLLDGMRRAGVTLRLSTTVDRIARAGEGFHLAMGGQTIACTSLVVATGGKSIPKMGATGFGYEIARQFGVAVTQTRPRPRAPNLRGGPCWSARRLWPASRRLCGASCGQARFSTRRCCSHPSRAFSGPAILQISSYWREGEENRRRHGARRRPLRRPAAGPGPSNGRQAAQTVLAQHLPKRLAQWVADSQGAQGNIADLSDARPERAGRGDQGLARQAPWDRRATAPQR